jgi:hypothetical protein
MISILKINLLSIKMSQMLNWLVRMSAEFESNITSVERIKEYCETPHEVTFKVI